MKLSSLNKGPRSVSCYNIYCTDWKWKEPCVNNNNCC